MTTVRVIIDQMIAPVPGGIGRYTEELTRALIDTAPPDCDIAGIVSASTEREYENVLARLPGLARLEKSALARRELMVAWQLGFPPLPNRGMVHSPSLLAPLRKHDRLHNGDQIAVTIHDTVPWTHPQTLTSRGVAWHKAMARRAERFADAIVVPTHAVANELSEILAIGDRVRVIGGAASRALVVGSDADVARLELPDKFVLAVGTLEPRKGIDTLIRAMADPRAPELPLLIAGPSGWGDVDVATLAADAGLADGRVRALGYLSDRELATTLSRATVFAYPSRAEGFGLPVLEAMSLGTPVVHTDVPALVEVAAGAGLVVALDDEATLPARLADAVARVVDDPDLAHRLRIMGLDTARAHSWKSSAEKVWQLHADL